MPRRLRVELAGDVERLGARAGLRRFRRRAMMRVAARDLAGAPLDDVVAEISAIADACITKALRLTDHGALAVVGLGKLGRPRAELRERRRPAVPARRGRARGAGSRRARGRIARRHAGRADRRRARAPCRRGAAARAARAGALSRSLEATLAYYARESATWERQAMIKARPIAGPPELGEGFLAGIEPFVYPPRARAGSDRRRPPHEGPARGVRAPARQGAHRGQARARRHQGRGVRRAAAADRARAPRRETPHAEHPRGPGERWRTRDTSPTPTPMRSPARIGSCGRSSTGCRSCGICRPTTFRPPDAIARRSPARSVSPTPKRSPRSTSARRTSCVRSTSVCSTGRCWSRSPVRRSCTRAHGTDRPATEELLRGLSFADPARSYDVLGRLVDPSGASARCSRTCSRSWRPRWRSRPAPDAALLRLERIADAVGLLDDGRDRVVADLLATDPVAARRLAHLAAASSFAVDLLVADPTRIAGMSDTLLGGETDAAGRSRRRGGPHGGS